MERRKETILLFPYMAQGHLIPFLALALHLEQKGYKIAFVNTPLNIKKLRPCIPPNSSIQLLEIPFNSSEHGLPSNAENLDSLPPNLRSRLFEASSCLEPSFRKLLADIINEQGGVKPVYVISDFFFGWAADVAHEFRIFHAIFSCAGGFGLACYHSMWLNLPHRDNDKGEFMLPDFSEAGKFHISQLYPSLLAADGSDPFSLLHKKCFSTWANSDGLLFNTVEKLDRIGLEYFRRTLRIPVWAVGPIILAVDERAKVGKKTGKSTQQYLEWLDSKPANSVLYISFGSQNTISASQMMQLAKALDASGTNFIWVVRPPVGFDMNANFKPEEWLPEGFVQRIMDEKKGLLAEQWAPQWEILSHKSVAAFLSHCGWNSVLESLSNAVPLIGWPISAEQFINAELLAEWIGVCVEVARGTNVEVKHEDIKDKIDVVMGENDRAAEFRRKACEVRNVIKEATKNEDSFKGPSRKAMEDFLNAALQMKYETADQI